MAEWKLRAAVAQDLATSEKLLESCELSADGARDQFGEGYVIAERQGELIGLAGVEIHGRHGLLRSVAVAPVLRGAGLGAELVDDRIRWARQQGIESIYLLTTMAAIFRAARFRGCVARRCASRDSRVERIQRDVSIDGSVHETKERRCAMNTIYMGGCCGGGGCGCGCGD